MAKPTTIKIRLNSTAGTGHFYVTKKNARTMTEKMTVRKYDPVARKHVEYKEGKIKLGLIQRWKRAVLCTAFFVYAGCSSLPFGRVSRWNRAIKKASVRAGLLDLCLRSFYSRLPNKLSNIMNMLMKLIYRLSAPMMAAFPSHSVSPCCANITYSLLIRCVS